MGGGVRGEVEGSDRQERRKEIDQAGKLIKKKYLDTLLF